MMARKSRLLAIVLPVIGLIPLNKISNHLKRFSLKMTNQPGEVLSVIVL
jgi:hypothetical protein